MWGLWGWLRRAEVADVGLGGDVIERGSGVCGKEGVEEGVDKRELFAGRDGGEVVGVGRHGHARGAAAEEQKTHADNATRAFCAGKV